MIEQMDGSYDNPFKFNTKELDEDTGLYYYGARYYNPRLSIWYGVDPLAEDYHAWSPYNYTLDNPIRYIDPDGRSVWPPAGGIDGQTWSDGDGDFTNKGGTWYKDNGSFVGIWAGDDWQYDSVGNTSPTSGYDGKIYQYNSGLGNKKNRQRSEKSSNVGLVTSTGFKPVTF